MELQGHTLTRLFSLTWHAFGRTDWAVFAGAGQDASTATATVDELALEGTGLAGGAQIVLVRSVDPEYGMFIEAFDPEFERVASWGIRGGVAEKAITG